MSRLHAVYMTEEELLGVRNMLTNIRDEMGKQAHASWPQYYAGMLGRALINSLVQRLDAQLTKIKQKGNT